MLRRRIIAAYVLLALVICGAFALAGYVSIEAAEREFIDRRLERAADHLIERHWNGQTDAGGASVSIFIGSAIPQDLRSFGPGIHELRSAGHSLRVLVREDRGTRFVFTDDESEFERIERIMYAGLAILLCACLGMAWLLGRLTASRVIAPVTRLAEAVERASPELPSLHAADEMGVLARAFSARTSELQDFLWRERCFTGDVSHELRTPLTVILGASEILIDGVADRPHLAAAAARIRRTAADASERVSAMLLLARPPEKVGAPRIALLPIVAQELERHRYLLAGKPVQAVIDADTEVHVFARPELAAIAIGNLVRNACQFTESGTVLVRLEPTRVVVEDTGPGLPQKIRARLFERFVHDEMDLASGSGLGLAIVQRVAAHLGWTVSLENAIHHGTHFIIQFEPARGLAGQSGRSPGS